MEADEQAEAACRAKEAGDNAYRKSFIEAAVYTIGALLYPRDITFLTNRAAAYFQMGKYEECVRDCDEAVKRGRELGSGNELIAKALSRKASALLELACCAADYTPAISALKLSLAESYSEETLEKLKEAESVRKEVEEQERLDQEYANQYREKGNEFFRQKKYHEAAIHYTRAMKMNPKDPRAFCNRAQCHIHLGAFPQGLQDAEKCIELDPTFLKGYVRKAKVQFLMESYENALATYLEGLKCDPNNPEVLDGLRRCAACVKGSNAGDVELEDLNYVEIEELKYFSKVHISYEIEQEKYMMQSRLNGHRKSMVLNPALHAIMNNRLFSLTGGLGSISPLFIFSSPTIPFFFFSLPSPLAAN